MTMFRPLAAVLALGVCAGAVHAQTQPLNDTGITISGDAGTNAATCQATASTVQDCHNGRDAAATAGVLTRTGASALNNGIANGFDYTRISNAGNDLPASATFGAGANDWACTRDNVTGLIWEVKTVTGLRSMYHTYTWYDSASPDGISGTADDGTGSTCAQVGRCDTEKFVQDVNASNLCGHNDWRMPSRRELQSIVDYGRSNPAIDPDYFPNTTSSYVWSGSPIGGTSSAWGAYFYDGRVSNGNRANNNFVRLVRGGQ